MKNVLERIYSTATLEDALQLRSWCLSLEIKDWDDTTEGKTVPEILFTALLKFLNNNPMESPEHEDALHLESILWDCWHLVTGFSDFDLASALPASLITPSLIRL